MGLPLTGASILGIMREKVDPVVYELFEHEIFFFLHET